LALAALTVALSLLFWRLGLWQWHRYEDRLQARHSVQQATTQDAAPLGQLVNATEPFDTAATNRAVNVSGSYDSATQLLQRNPDGRSGYEILTPLLLDAGQTLVVDRGWVGSSTTTPGEPATDVTPPSGTIEAVVRLEPFDAASGRVAPAGQTYDVTAEPFGNGVLPAYGQLVSQIPAPPDDVELPEAPSTSLGPHLFYAIQWWLFIGIALVGYVMLIRRQALDEANASVQGEQGVQGRQGAQDTASSADTNSGTSDDVTPLTGAPD
jgi:cytochrome oxidase assembly protein ShyY1